jgi:hypothetical protein
MNVFLFSLFSSVSQKISLFCFFFPSSFRLLISSFYVHFAPPYLVTLLLYCVAHKFPLDPLHFPTGSVSSSSFLRDELLDFHSSHVPSYPIYSRTFIGGLIRYFFREFILNLERHGCLSRNLHSVQFSHFSSIPL